MKKKLILHIGNHKTGTTSIQNALYQNRASLRMQGFSVFYHSANDKDTKDGHPGLWTQPFPEVHRGVSIHRGLASALSQLPDTVIMSQENFSWVREKSELKRLLLDLQKYFSEIQILAYIRRQDMQMISHHQQGSKNQNLLAARLFGSSPRALPGSSEGMYSYLDYHSRFSLWGEVFGTENITLRIFDKNELTNGDAVSDFSHVTGTHFEFLPERKNESNGFEMTKINHLMNQQNISMPLRSWVNSYLDNSGKLIPSKDEAYRFYELFKENNEKLNMLFNISKNPYIFSEDFSMYGEKPKDLWEEDSANHAMLHLLKAYSVPKFVKKEDLLLLETIASVLEKNNSAASKKIKSIFNF